MFFVTQPIVAWSLPTQPQLAVSLHFTPLGLSVVCGWPPSDSSFRGCCKARGSRGAKGAETVAIGAATFDSSGKIYSAFKYANIYSMQIIFLYIRHDMIYLASADCGRPIDKAAESGMSRPT